MTFSASISIAPPEVSTKHFFGDVNVAHPFTKSTPAPFRSASTPLLRRSTMSSFHDTSADMSSSGLSDTDIPICPSDVAC